MIRRRYQDREVEWRTMEKDGVRWFETDVGAFVIVFGRVDDDDTESWCCEVWRREDRAKPLAAPLFFTEPCCWEEASADSRPFVEAFEAVVRFLPTGDRSPVACR